VSKKNFSDLINSGANIKDIITMTGNGIGLISGGSGILELADLSNDKLEIVLQSISQLNDMADYILIDTGAGISNVVTAFAKLAHEVVVITTCEPTSVADAYALIKSLVIKDREKEISVVINRAENIREAQGVFDNINTVSSNFIKKDLNFLGFIYDDVSVSKAVKRQKAFIEMSPGSNASKCIASICDKLIDKKSDTQNFKNLVDRFKNLFR
jgi:flagellar synthesis regulator fleN